MEFFGGKTFFLGYFVGLQVELFLQKLVSVLVTTKARTRIGGVEHEVFQTIFQVKPDLVFER